MVFNRSMLTQQDKIYLLALTFLDGIGPITQRKLLMHFDPEEIFSPGFKHPGFPKILSQQSKKNIALEKAHKELESMEKHGIKMLCIADAEYPKKLKQCYDAPVLLFVKGNINFQQKYSLAVVGTRKCTQEAKLWIERFISDLKDMSLQIVSGMATGVDITAHLAAMDNNLSTVAVMAHGLHIVYPPQHKKHAIRLLDHNNCMVSEYPIGQDMHPGNFPSRNRIIAGLSDAVLVVESDVKGGAMITAQWAIEYDRELLAVPGRPGIKTSSGCNHLIKQNMAQLIENAADLLAYMNWKKDDAKQTKLFEESNHDDLTEDEKSIMQLFEHQQRLHLEHMLQKLGWNPQKLLSVLLQLELKGKITALPGKFFSPV